MRVIIAGSRYKPKTRIPIRDMSLITQAISNSGWQSNITATLSGGAIGIDTLGEQWSRAHGITPMQFFPKWRGENNDSPYKPTAGFDRNELMADIADALIAVWDGESEGTLHMIDCMLELGKPVHLEIIS